MVERDRLRRILTLALPIIGGMVSQNVLNLVDTAMVGTLGDAALAAVGLGGFANFMFMALVLGVSTGVQAMASRRKGAGRLEETALPLNAGLVLVLIGGPVLTFVVYQLVPALYPLLNDDPAVVAQGVPYLEWRVLAITVVGCNFAFRGYWNAVDLSRLYMSTLVTMHAVNIFLNWVLIFGNLGAPALGTEGAGMASAASTLVGLGTYLYLGSRHARAQGFMKALPPRSEIARLVTLSLPTGIQQLFFSTGFVVLFWIIGQVGTPELAAASVLINLMLVAILPGMGLGLSSSTLVGQALGRGHPEDAGRWGWDVVKVGMVLMGVLGLPLLLFPDPILGVFIHDPGTLAVARFPAQLMGATLGMEAMVIVLMHSLLGAGDAKRVMFSAVGMQWCLFLPGAWLLGAVLGFGLTAIWIWQVCYRGMMAFMFIRYWTGKGWTAIEV